MVPTDKITAVPVNSFFIQNDRMCTETVNRNVFTNVQTQEWQTEFFKPGELTHESFQVSNEKLFMDNLLFALEFQNAKAVPSDKCNNQAFNTFNWV